MTALPVARLAAYGALGLPLATAALPIYVHLPNLYGKLGLGLAALGFLLLAARLADAFIDPWLGAAADRLQRPRLLCGLGMLLLTAGILAALNPPADAALLWWWLAAALLPLYLGYSLAVIAYMAWGSLLGDTPHERTRVTASREGFGLAGVVLASVLPGLLAATLETGLARFSLVFTAVALVCTAVTLALAPAGRAAARPERLRLAALVEPFASQAFRRLFLVFVINGIAAALPATLVLFFVEDALGLAPQAGNFLAAYFVAGAVSLPGWVALSRRIGKPRAWLASMLIAVAAFVWAYGLGAGDFTPFLVVCLLSGFALGADLAFPAAMLADVIRGRGDDGRAGAYFGLWNFASKLNLALAAGLALPFLGFAGYTPGAAQALGPLYLAYCLMPCVLKLLAAALLWRFFLSGHGVPRHA